MKLGLQLENLEASLQQHVTWPLSLTCEDTEGFLTDERHSMGHMPEVKLNSGQTLSQDQRLQQNIQQTAILLISSISLH